MIFHEEIRITGVANQTVDHKGLESTEKEPKKLISVLAQVSAYEDANVEGWIEKTRVFNIPDKLIDTLATTPDAATQSKTAQRINEIPVDVDLAVGEIFKVAVRSGATPIDFIGCYVYEVKAG